jgi:hypothetical protein
MALIQPKQLADQYYYITGSFFGDGSGLTGVSGGSVYTQSFNNQSTWVVQHNLNLEYVIVQTYDNNEEQIIPETIDLTDSNTTTITFPSTISGTAVIAAGSSGGSSAAGANKDIQFNFSGSLGAVSIPGWFSFNRDLVQFTIGRNPVIGSSANYSIYSGENNILNSRDTIISGENNRANGIARGSFINGRYNTASAAYSFVTGKYNYVATDDPDTAGGFATGFNNRVLANYGVALGFQGLVVGNSGVTVGQNTTASFYGLACGDDTYAAFAAVSTGNDTRANSRYTLTGGSTTKAGGNYADFLYVSESAPTGSNEDTSDIDTNQKWYQPSTDTLYIYVGPSGFGTWVSQNDYSPYITVTHYNINNGLYTYPTFSVGDSFLPYVSGALQARSNYGTARFSHAEGSTTTTFGRAAHSEGISTEAAGWYSHTEGNGTRTGNPFTRGAVTVADGPGLYAHAEGIGSVASGRGAHAQGYFTYAIGTASFSSGLSSFAWGDYQAVFGKYNDYVTSSLCLFIVGNGSSTSNRNNLAEFWTTSTAADNPHGAAINFNASLAVKDFLTIRPRTTTPTTPIEGMIIASGSSGASKLYYYDGTSWNTLF